MKIKREIEIIPSRLDEFLQTANKLNWTIINVKPCYQKILIKEKITSYIVNCELTIPDNQTDNECIKGCENCKHYYCPKNQKYIENETYYYYTNEL